MPARLQPWFYVALFGLVAGCCAGAPAQERADALTIESARVGIAGVSKAGFWTPIWLDLKAGPRGAAGMLQIVVPDGDNVPVVYASESGPIALKPGEKASMLRYAKIGRENATIQVRLVSSEPHGSGVAWSQELAKEPPRLAATQELILGIGEDLNLKRAIATSRRSSELALAVVQTNSAADLPDHWLGYEGVDWIVLAVGDGKLLESFSAAQREALLLWLRLGGRIIVSVGQEGERVAAGDNPWRVLLPGKLVEVSPLRDRAGLEVFTGTELPWEEDEFQRTRPLVTRLDGIDGVVLADEIGSGTDRPLVIRSAHGLGEVTFVGLDLAHPGFAKWAGRPKFLSTMLGAAQGAGDEGRAPQRAGLTHLGYDDLIGQLRAALDQFPGVTLVSFTTVSVLMAAYLLLIGPGDYLLLSRLSIPRQVTWLTFGLVALGFAVTAWLVGRSTHGAAVRVNQLEIVDIDASRGVIRGTLWAHVYCPQTARFSVQARPVTDVPLIKPDEGALAWQGLPGHWIGGLASKQRALTAIEPYRTEGTLQQPGLGGLPVQSASSKSLVHRWWGTTSEQPASSLTRNSFGALDGELSNPLPFALADCLIAFEDKLYRLGTLAPGQTVSMDRRSPLNLEARLTERTIEGAREVSSVWNRDSTDIPRIVRMLMFHEAARGRSYTGLTHRFQPYLDLSSQLRLGRAVLAGQAERRLSQLSLDGEQVQAADPANTSQTFVRVIFPVSMQPAQASPP